MDKSEKNNSFEQTGIKLPERKPNYGRGMRKLRGILDLNQKQMAAKLDMTSQQLSNLEKKEQWTDDMLQRVSEKLNIPQSGLDYLAGENDLISYIIQNNTLSDTSTMTNNNGCVYHTYNFGNVDRAEELISKMENLVAKLNKNTESLKKVMPRKSEK